MSILLVFLFLFVVVVVDAADHRATRTSIKKFSHTACLADIDGVEAKTRLIIVHHYCCIADNVLLLWRRRTSAEVTKPVHDALNVVES